MESLSDVSETVSVSIIWKCRYDSISTPEKILLQSVASEASSLKCSDVFNVENLPDDKGPRFL